MSAGGIPYDGTDSRVLTQRVEGLPLLRLLTLAGQLLSLRLETVPERDGLRLSEIRVLLALATLPVSRASDVAAWSGLRPSTLTSVAGRLVDAGLVARAPGADRREQHLELTAAGRTRIDATVRANTRHEPDVLAGLSKDERASLRDALVVVVCNLIEHQLCDGRSRPRVDG